MNKVHRFPKTARLRTRAEFRHIQREGKRLMGKFLCFQSIHENFMRPSSSSRLGITVSKQFGSAVARNLFKRRVREVFRLQKSHFPCDLQLHISPVRKGVGLPTVQQVEEDFNDFKTRL